MRVSIFCRKTVFILVLMIPFLSFTFSQEPTQIKKINSLFDSLKTFENDTLRLLFHKQISTQIKDLLFPAASFNIPLDSLRIAGKVKSPDEKFRILTWNVSMNDGTSSYFGIIQMNPDKEQECKLFLLNDISHSVQINANSFSYKVPDWFGALYYNVLKVKVGNTVVYTLLAARFKDLFSNQKVLESLYFDDDSTPIFGFPVFEYGLKLEKRVVFEYSINAVMSLKYLDDIQMIVFDHLSPSSPIYTNNFKFYGPDFSYDGYKFEKGKWNYMPNISMKNEKNTKRIIPKKRINSAPKR